LAFSIMMFAPFFNRSNVYSFTRSLVECYTSLSAELAGTSLLARECYCSRYAPPIQWPCRGRCVFLCMFLAPCIVRAWLFFALPAALPLGIPLAAVIVSQSYCGVSCHNLAFRCAKVPRCHNHTDLHSDTTPNWPRLHQHCCIFSPGAARFCNT
jgi:hypothetical protein